VEPSTTLDDYDLRMLEGLGLDLAQQSQEGFQFEWFFQLADALCRQ
jgi:hypothetical protein